MVDRPPKSLASTGKMRRAITTSLAESVDALLNAADGVQRHAIAAINALSEKGECEPVAVEDDGWSEWLHPTAPSFFSQCCDCGLVHEMEFEIVPRDAHNTNLNPGEGDSVIVFRARRALASADTHAKHRDVEQARPARVGSAVAATSGETPSTKPGAPDNG